MRKRVNSESDTTGHWDAKVLTAHGTTLHSERLIGTTGRIVIGRTRSITEAPESKMSVYLRCQSVFDDFPTVRTHPGFWQYLATETSPGVQSPMKFQRVSDATVRCLLLKFSRRGGSMSVTLHRMSSSYIYHSAENTAEDAVCSGRVALKRGAAGRNYCQVLQTFEFDTAHLFSCPCAARTPALPIPYQCEIAIHSSDRVVIAWEATLSNLNRTMVYSTSRPGRIDEACGSGAYPVWCWTWLCY